MVHKRNLFSKLGISSQYELFSLLIDDLEPRIENSNKNNKLNRLYLAIGYSLGAERSRAIICIA